MSDLILRKYQELAAERMISDDETFDRLARLVLGAGRVMRAIRVSGLPLIERAVPEQTPQLPGLRVRRIDQGAVRVEELIRQRVQILADGGRGDAVEHMRQVVQTYKECLKLAGECFHQSDPTYQRIWKMLNQYVADELESVL